MGVCEFCDRTTRFGCGKCRKMFCCDQCKEEGRFTGHKLVCRAKTIQGKHSAPSSPQWTDTKRVKRASSSPDADYPETQLPDNSESYLSPPAAQPGPGDTPESQKDESEEESKPSTFEDEDSGELSEDLDAVDEEALLDAENEKFFDMIRGSDLLKVLGKIKPENYLPIVGYTVYRKKSNDDLRKALFATLALRKEEWMALWTQHKNPAAYFLLRNVVHSVGVLVQSKFDSNSKRFLLTGCRYDQGLEKLKKSVVLIYKDQTDDTTVKRCWEIIHILITRTQAFDTERLHQFFENTAKLSTRNGPKSFLTSKVVNTSFYTSLLDSLKRSAVRYTQIENYSAPIEYYSVDEEDRWDEMDRMYFARYGIIHEN